jgi:type IV pilus assembly protein PilO
MLTLISGGYYTSMHMSLEEETQDAQRQHAVLTNELNQARERQKEYLRLREELAAREATDKQNMRVLPETAEIPAFLDDLNRLAELSGLRVGNVGPRAEATEQFFVRVPVSLNIAGKFHQLMKFFYNVSRLERAINMENVSLTQPTKEGEDLIMSVSVLATTFRRPDSAGAAK